MNKSRTNPFTFGDLALDEAFTDREDEVAELLADMRNCLLYTSPSPRDGLLYRMPSSA